jgi:arylsulfatase A-like enzyme
MTRRELARALGHDAAVALGAGLVVALVAAAVRGVGTAEEQGYLTAGYWRIAVASGWAHFVEWLPLAAGIGLTLAVLGRLTGLTRGPGMRRAALVATALVALLFLATVADRWRVRHGPNLVLISIDTLRADHLGAYGYSRGTSPTVDARLAAQGVTFEEVYSHSPKTTPSHMTLFTSLYPSVHGVELWDERTPGHVLNPVVHTLAEVLKNAGYATAAYTGGANVHAARGFDQGFDVYKHSGQLRRAKRWLSRHRRGKFFLFFHTYDVHDPYVPPPHWMEHYAAGYDGPVRAAVERLRDNASGWWRGHRLFWESVDRKNPRDGEFVERLYDATIRHMDEATLAPLLEHLDSLGLAGETLIVFTSDHGEAFGEHGVFLHDDLYAGTLHVPLILRLPGTLPAGRRVGTRAGLVDVMPTVLELLGVPAPAGMQGTSLVPLLAGDDAQPRTAVSEYSNRAIGRVFESMRHARLSYIVDGSSERLFDLAADPAERRNVVGERPDALATMRDELARWRESCRPLAARIGPRTESAAPDAETARRLKALGYLQ